MPIPISVNNLVYIHRPEIQNKDILARVEIPLYWFLTLPKSGVMFFSRADLLLSLLK